MGEENIPGNLIVPLIFRVISAHFPTESVWGRPEADGDPTIQSWIKGCVQKAVLRVESESSEGREIKVLRFIGSPHLESGDRIRALVPKYKEGERYGYHPEGRAIRIATYSERPFQETEQVSRIEKLADDGSVRASWELT